MNTQLKLARALVVTALPGERAAVIHHLKEVHQHVDERGTAYEIGSFGSWSICVLQASHGNVSAAVETERAISFFAPKVALFVGIAGGVKDVNIGDVVVATKMYSYEGGADKTEFLPRPAIGLPSYPLVQMALAVSRKSSWQVHLSSSPNVLLAPIAAGEKVIKSSRGNIAKLLKQTYGDAVAVEMEGIGFLHAAFVNRIDAAVIRGISDLLDGKAAADKGGSQTIAAKNAAAFAFELLSELEGKSVLQVVNSAHQLGSHPRPSIHKIEPEEFWVRLRECCVNLYPRGPDENNIWGDAGGDISRLNLSEDGHTQWMRALEKLKVGGGGRLSPIGLISKMLEAYSENYELQDLKRAFSENR